jgi:asparagine synthase (glutamine-hydrolysing)
MRDQASSSAGSEGTWVLRWDTGGEPAPRLLRPELGAPGSPDVYRADSGSLVILDGYLFDRGDLALRSGGSDASLVASAYERWGTGLFDKLRGGYVVAIWDAARERLLVARDATLLASCFYAWDGRTFLTSPDLDTLLTQPEVSGRFNRIVIAEYLQDAPSGHQTRETFYEGVWRLPPAHVLSLGTAGPSVSRYWDPVPPGFSWASDGDLSRFVPEAERAVGRCLSVGADSLALSGGFDSVSIAVLAAEQLRGKPPLHAISLRFAHPACDEGPVQAAVAGALGMPQMMRTVDESLDGQGLIEVALDMSRASSSPVLTPWQSMFRGLVGSAARLGLRRMLMGNGGDELYDVHGSYASDLLAAGELRELWRFFIACRRSSSVSTARIAQSLLWRRAVRPQLGRAARGMLGTVSPRAKDWIVARRRQRLPMPWLAPPDRALFGELEDRRRHPVTVEHANGEGDYACAIRSLLLDPYTLMGQDQVESWTRRLGVKPLCPYFDRDLMELSLRIHPEHLISGGWAKAPLRRLVAERLPVQLPPRKVSFTPMFHQAFRPAGRDAWRAMGGASALGELEIVDPHQADRLMDRYFGGDDSKGIPAWILFSTEAWLQARSGLLSTSKNGGMFDDYSA